MKRPDSFLTNTTAPAGRAQGAAKNNPGDDSGSGMDKEIYNDPCYAIIAAIQSYKDGGISDTDETTIASDMRDSLEELTHGKVVDAATPANSLAEWDNAVTYTTLGELVTWKGFQFVAFNVVGNLAKNPLTNPDFWFPIPKPFELLERFASGRVHSGGLSPIADRAGGDYQQNIAFGRYRLGGNADALYDFYRVALDGTQVTGDAILEAIFDVGGANEYFNIDIIAPDVVGTRTLLDLGEYVVTPQSVGGQNDTMGDLQDDRTADLYARLSHDGGTSRIYYDETASPAWNSDFYGTIAGRTASVTSRSFGMIVKELATAVTTRPKELTEGASYVIVMLPVA